MGVVPDGRVDAVATDIGFVSLVSCGVALRP
ncbi:hypothetical protein AFCDBAGC_1197 [Methylobacterium cerastii]|uniref:Uncharacterized protein n=1 Tax=Methylobacterium cerastii TaxID=932741 RepID=A0ABQ4QEU3_9HYPH|nr:hypothetical protein AFCDBAGC_1197 [Methylobacterium cerastii]